jgi:hypothetical protein
VIPSVLAVLISGSGGSWGLRFVCVCSIERNGRGVLLPPGWGNGRDLQGLERDRTEPLVEIGRTQRIEDGSQTVILQRSARESRLQQRHHAPLVQPFPHLVEGMMPIQQRARTRASTPRPHASPGAGWGGMRRSMTVATSRRPKRPRTNGQCTTG